MESKCILILGMHRSGTSAIAGVLSKLGIDLGDSLLPPVEDVNPKGFWEHAEVVSIHDQILDTLGVSWDDESRLPDQWWCLPQIIALRDQIVAVLRRDFGNQRLWLVKDPRMCRLLPLWQEIFSELDCQPLFVLCLRDPIEVVQSLRKRNKFADEASCLLWLIHMLDAEFQTRCHLRVFVGYENLLSDWRGTVKNIGETLQLTWPRTIEHAAPSVEAFLDSSLCHRTVRSTLGDHPANKLAQNGFDLLSNAFLNTDDLDHLRAETYNLIDLVAPWSAPRHQFQRKILTLENQNSLLESRIAVLQSEIARIKHTVSWQITKPLRFVWNTLSKLPFNSREHGS